jgi:hypothetical protein
MLYEVNEEKLLELVQKVYEEAITGYYDLKDSVCERLVRNFLEDTKRIPSITNMSLSQNTNTTEVGLFGSEVYTITDRIHTNERQGFHG